jgi:3-oxoacyl-[acyl-carrier protein] reductase
VSRSVVVTGGARGIGDAIIGAFREIGDEVVSLDVIEPEEARDGVRYLEADVSDWDAVAGRLAGLERIDVLVNNAGIQRLGLTGELGPDDWRRVLDVHLTGAFVCTSAAVPKMASGGAIVSIASAAAFVGLPGRGAYSAAKAALVGWTRVLAVELAPRGIRANAVAPGFTRTGLVDQALRDGSLQEAWMLARVPLGRLADPAEIARVVRFLASDDASYVTGHTLAADGGWTAQGIGSAPGWLAPEPPST